VRILSDTVHVTALSIRLAFIAVLAALPRVASATLADEVTRLATPLVDASGLNPNRSVGLVVVVATRDGNQVFGFGAVRAGTTNRPAGHTFFQIGSVSKSLTGLMLAAAIEDSAGAIAANDPVNAHLASDLRVPGWPGQPVTLEHLATHLASLPDMPTNLTGPVTSPGKDYSRTQLAEYLATLTLPAPPGGSYQYSNLGFGLLGLALSDTTGAGGYSSLVQTRLTGPLGMSDTGLNEPGFVAQLGARLAQGYRVSGGALVEVGLSDMGVLEGSGEVISTGADMGMLLRAFTGLGSFPVTGAVERAVSPVAPGPAGTMAGYGLDIVSLPNGVTQYEKAGSVAGYTCFIAFRREPGVGVAILSNRGQHQAILPLARQIVALLPPPSLNLEITAPESLNVSFPAFARLSYELQRSTNLANWITCAALTNATGSNTTLTVTLPRTNPAAFYRLRY
jgi:CubicO group peptidase (beta-lactamase class C family)